MADNTGWTWSPIYGRYYRSFLDNNGQSVTDWAPVPETPQVSASQAAPAPVIAATPSAATQHGRTDSVVDGEAPPPVPWDQRAHLPNFIAGTPEAGWVDSLDSSYYMRTGGKARQFFKKGRVFATLYTEPTGGTAQHNSFNPAYTTVRFGASVYTQIRRFVVVSVRKNFVYAIAIATYGKQGTLKNGCNPGEHAVIYNTGIDPESCYLVGERPLSKHPIEVRAADATSYLSPESRVRFGKAYAIEWNVKVKDIGMVRSAHMGILLAYYADENRELQ